MNAKQSRFVEEYLKDLNATQAAIRAGYSAHTAKAMGSRLLTIVDVKAAIQDKKAKRAIGGALTQKRVLKELRALAFSSITHYQIDDKGNVQLAPGAPPNAMAAISSIDKKIIHAPDGSIAYEVKLKFWDKPGTLKLAGRHVDVKGFSDRMEVTGKDGGPVQITAMTVAEAQAAIAELEAKARAKMIDAQAVEVPPAEPPRGE